MSEPLPNEYLGYTTWKAWSKDTFGTYTAKERKVFAGELRRARVSLNNESTVLEVGFGNGAFAAWVRQRTRHYVGTEINPELIARAKAINIDARVATLDLDTIARNRNFDLIAIFDVLEHLGKDEIIRVLRAAHQCLSPTGTILVRVPSGDSPFARHLMHGDITHKSALGSLAFTQLAVLSGLKLVGTYDALYPIFGMGTLASIKRMLRLSIQTLLNSIIRAIYYSNESIVLAPNLVAVLRQTKQDTLN